MRITGTRARGRSLRTLTLALVMTLLVAMLLAGTALAAGHNSPGKSAKPATPKASAPSGTVNTTTPTFSWTKAKSAAKYEVRVYQGATQVLKKTGIPKLRWKSTATLPTNVDLTWKVRASNGSGTSVWSKSLTFTIVPLALAIGDPYQGGIVAYVLQSSDPGYDVNVLHGLIAATADQGGTRECWSIARTFESTGAIATALGTGSANTDKIIAAQGTTTRYAALLARAYDGGNYADWYLPGKDELNKLYLNQAAIGGFAAATYWSSSQYDGPTVWVQFFGTGGPQNHQWREMGGAVRAVRAF